ncbi:MAG: type I-G CRISPR-associated protein, Cas3-extension family [Pseudonocardiaceae bacterium]
MSRIELPALDGRNPLGFLATLGAHQLLATHADHDATLCWHPTTCLPALGTARFTNLDELATWLVELAVGQPEEVLQPGWPPGFPPPGEAPDKLVPQRATFPDVVKQHPGAERLIGALVTDLAVNDADRVRRTPMVAPTGKQSFSTMLINQDRRIRADPDLLRQALTRWRRIRDTTGEGFDGAAIIGGADDPRGRPGERAVPGAVWLAIAGLARYRLATDDRGRTAATAWRRVGRNPLMVWSLWTPPLDTDAILVLLEHPELSLRRDPRDTLMPRYDLTPLGVTRICAAERIGGGNSDGPLIPVRVQPPR